MSPGDEFLELPVKDQEEYRDHGHKLVTIARNHAIPIVFAPRLSLGGRNPVVNQRSATWSILDSIP